MMIVTPRVPEWWEVACGALRLGMVVCPATTLLVPKDLEYRANVSKAVCFVGDHDSAQKFDQIKESKVKVKLLLRLVSKDPMKGWKSYDEELEDVPDDTLYTGPKTKSSDPAIIYFTSGTSGHPKMVLHNQISYPLGHTITGKYWLRLKPGKTYWNLSEQGWAKAAWSFFGTWNCGACLFVQDDRGAFDPIHLLDTIHKYPITTICCPPTIYRNLVLKEKMEYMRKNAPKSLEHCIGAGEPLNPEVINIWKEATGLEIRDGYGQTETVLVCGNFADNKVRPGSMGKPSPGIPLFVIDDNGQECKVDTEGDISILVKDGDNTNVTPWIFDGYLNPKDESLSRPLRTDGNRDYYLTGDRATRDKDGYIWFVGRNDDVISSSGYRIGPFEVESALKEHPGIIESAVVASPDKSRGEIVKAFIVLTDEYAKKQAKDEAGLIKEIQDFTKKQTSPYKYPREIEFLRAEQLPKTISGKIRRVELRELEKKRKAQAKM